MKKVIVYIKPFKLNRILDIIIERKWDLLFIQEVKEYNLTKSNDKFLPRFQLQFWIPTNEIEALMKIVAEYNFSFEENEQEILIHEINETIEIQSGERNIFQNF